jgi:hypothetical protein
MGPIIIKWSCKLFVFFAVSMNARTLPKKSITFLLLLIFFQQMGAGLFVHNLVHDKKSDQSPIEQRDNGREINFACKCIDDFLMPFVADDQLPVLHKPELVLVTYDIYTESILHAPFLASLLRGPPVFMS